MSVRVEVVLALPARQEVVPLSLAEGATVADAVAASGLRERFAGLDWARATYGIWSRACPPHRTLREGDRVEIYRPLAADPKDQRRTRARASPRSRSGP